MTEKETPIFSAVGAVYKFDEAGGGWSCVDGGASDLWVFAAASGTAFRVLGLASSTKQWSVNSPLTVAVAQEAEASVAAASAGQALSAGVQFVSWRDETAGAGVGLHFAAAADADAFLAVLRDIRDRLERAQARAALTPRSAMASAAGAVVATATATAPAASSPAAKGAPRPPPTASPRLAAAPTASGRLVGPVASPSSLNITALASPAPVSASAPASASPLSAAGATPAPRTSVGGSMIARAAAAASATAAAGGAPRTSISLAEPDGARNLRKVAASGLSERELVAREILLTEESYLASLERLVQCLEAASQPSSPLSEADARAIFLNVRALRALATQLCTTLAGRVESWSDTSTRLGDVFVQLGPFFKVYAEYCQQYDQAAQAFERAATDKRKREFLRQFEPLSADGAPQRLSFLLVMPVQRIPRYVLLLKELTRRTSPEHPDAADLAQALAQMQQFAASVNEQIRHTEQARRLNEVLDNAKKAWPGLRDALDLEHHRLLAEFELQAPTGPTGGSRTADGHPLGHAMVFSGLLCAFAPVQLDGKTEVRRLELALQLELVWLDAPPTSRTQLLLRTPDAAPHVLEWPDDVGRRAGAQALDRAIAEHLQARGIRTEASAAELAAVAALELSGGPQAPERRFLSVQFSGTSARTHEGWFAHAVPAGQGSCAWANGNRYEGEWLEGKMHGAGKFVHRSGGTLEGEFRAGLPQGKATLRSEAYSYVGQWQAGQRHGDGELRTAHGDVLVGAFEYDVLAGQGTLLAADGSRYQGGFRTDRFHGMGTFTSQHGVYTGEWQDGKRHGRGTLVYLAGERYEGQWQDDRRHGPGSLQSADGKVRYEGEWLADKRHGRGKQQLPHETYVGDFKEDRRAGTGLLTRSDGSVYEGEFAANVAQGKGRLTRKDGYVYDGTWHQARRFARGTELDPVLGRYEGEWKADMPQGRGTMRYADGARYEGTWDAGARHGDGLYVAAYDASRYQGAWDRDRRAGRGNQVDPCGRFDGEWRGDRRHGPGRYVDLRSQVLYEGSWLMDKRDGDGLLTWPDGTQLKATFRNGTRIRPAVLPPLVPPPLHFTH